MNIIKKYEIRFLNTSITLLIYCFPIKILWHQLSNVRCHSNHFYFTKSLNQNIFAHFSVSNIRFINHSTCWGASWSKNADSFISKAAIFSRSAFESSKSKISMFSTIRSGRTDFAKATIPRCINQRSTTWPTVLPYC